MWTLWSTVSISGFFCLFLTEKPCTFLRDRWTWTSVKKPKTHTLSLAAKGYSIMKYHLFIVYHSFHFMTVKNLFKCTKRVNRQCIIVAAGKCLNKIMSWCQSWTSAWTSRWIWYSRIISRNRNTDASSLRRFHCTNVDINMDYIINILFQYKQMLNICRDCTNRVKFTVSASFKTTAMISHQLNKQE